MQYILLKNVEPRLTVDWKSVDRCPACRPTICSECSSDARYQLKYLPYVIAKNFLSLKKYPNDLSNKRSEFVSAVLLKLPILTKVTPCAWTSHAERHSVTSQIFQYTFHGRIAFVQFGSH
jgi:hypothetical protein